MNAIIPVTTQAIGTHHVQACNARDLHEFLQVGKDFSNWIKARIDQYGFEEGADFSPVLAKSTGGRPSTEYIVTLDMAKELAMVERNSRGKQARRYFIECERQLRQRPSQPVPDLRDQLIAAQARCIQLMEAQQSTGRLKQTNKPFTDEEEAMCRSLIDRGLPKKEIAQIMGRSSSAIRERIIRHTGDTQQAA